MHTLINEGSFKKHVYLFFDTYIGRGDITLSKQLDLSLTDFINEECLDSVLTQYGSSIIQKNMTLNDFKILHYKTMDVASKIFT